MNETICKNRKFFDMAVYSDARGFCRRYPPKLFLLPENEQATLLPEVAIIDWCGEFQPTAEGGES